MLSLSRRNLKYVFAGTLLLLLGCHKGNDESISLERAEQHLQSAVWYQERGEEGKVIHEYEKAISLSPPYLKDKLCARLGKFCLETERYSEAEKAFRLAIDQNPTLPSYHFLLGFTYYKMLKNSEAEKCFKEVLKLAPDYPYTYLCLGEIYLRQDNLEEARKTLLKAIAQYPQNAETHYQIGIVYSRQGYVKKALREFQKAVRADPNQYAYRYRLGRELLRFGREEEGAKELEVYRKLYKKVVERKVNDRKERGSNGFPNAMVRSFKDRLSPSSPATASTPGVSSVKFINVIDLVGICFKHYNDVKDTATILETTGSGVAFTDYDNDGKLDVYLVNCSKLNPTTEDKQHRNTLWRNIGDGLFIEVTERAGVGDTGYGMGCVFGDYDNDGDDDLYVTNYGANALYRNNGDGSFTDVTAVAGVGNRLWGTSCAFADYDNDGDLDLYVDNYVDFRLDGLRYCYVHSIKTGCTPGCYKGQPDVLYRNNGDGTFTDVTKQAGLYSDPGIGLGVAFGDYDNDGDPDIYVANDTTENFLYRNNGDGTFTNTALIAGVSCNDNGIFDSGMGVDFGDYDNDGNLDIFVTNFQNMTNTLYHNEGDGFFTYASHSSRLGKPSFFFLGFGTKFFDYDNDGYLDIFVANGHVQDNVELFEASATYRQKNQLFVNNHDGTFTEVTSIAGEGFAVKKASRGAAFGDYDNDGDIDILISNSNDTPTLLRNEGGNKNNSLSIKVIGVVSNRDGIGTRVKIKCASLTQIRELRSGSSYLSDHDRRLLFGVGGNDIVESVEIRWPSGIIQKFENTPVSQALVVKESYPDMNPLPQR